jgi:hypothetical protein
VLIVSDLARVLPNHGLWDFGSFVASARAAREGLNPYGVYPLTMHVVLPGFDAYNPNLNPPISALLFRAFDVADPQASLRVWWAISVACYVLTVLLLVARYGARRAVLIGLPALALAGFSDTLFLGQIYLPLVLAAVGAWLLLERGQGAFAGLLIGLVVAMKPNFLVWPVLLLLSRHYRPAFVALGVAALVSAVPLLAMGPEVYRQWVELLASDRERAAVPHQRVADRARGAGGRVRRRPRHQRRSAHGACRLGARSPPCRPPRQRVRASCLRFRLADRLDPLHAVPAARVRARVGLAGHSRRRAAAHGAGAVRGRPARDLDPEPAHRRLGLRLGPSPVPRGARPRAGACDTRAGTDRSLRVVWTCCVARDVGVPCVDSSYLSAEKLETFVQGFYWMLPNFGIALAVAILFFAGAWIARAVLSRWFRRRGRENLGELLGEFARWGVLLFGALVVAAIIFPSIKPADLLSTLGIGSIAIGFAFKDILQNWLAGLLILIRQPFTTGDQIVVSGYEGTVQHIEARATLIKTYDGRLVVIPNADVYSKAVTVNTAFEKRRSEYALRHWLRRRHRPGDAGDPGRARDGRGRREGSRP